MTKSLYEFTIEELDRELIARTAPGIKEEHFQFDHPEETPERDEMMGRIKQLYTAPPPKNKEMEHISTRDIIIVIKEKSRGKKKEDAEEMHDRGIIGEDDRMDFYELEAALRNKRFLGESPGKESLEAQRDLADMENIKRNLDATAVICLANCLESNNGFAALRVRTLKERYGLCECERFANQLTALGKMCTCFLVKDDVVATAGHFLNEGRVEDMRIVFGFKMKNANTAITTVPITNVYKVKKIIGKSHDRSGNAPDWGLLELDRKVENQEIVKISTQEVAHGQSVYTLGHPAGLPLKFATGASIHDSTNNHFFRADLDIFMGNSGSPVFDMKTHELIGLVAHGYSIDFRYVNNCLISVIYPPPKSEEKSQLAECTRNSAFRHLLDRDNN
ncbi:MAG TPA: trypsin-like peptidase domain-containing protein [Candidatus Deferrimicrobium sp.]|nr:trypsin-like peptidase domain-containing protein [Candidatus Deferrimicrobium sp.]